MATLEEIHRVWALLCASYPGWARDLPRGTLDHTLRVYERLLRDVSGEVLEEAALQHVAASRFFPTVAELREGALSAGGEALPSAIEAWGEVKRELSRCGRYGKPRFQNAIAARIVALLGWVSLCDSGNEAADRARFLESYEELSRRARDEARRLPEARRLRERPGARRAALGEKAC